MERDEVYSFITNTRNETLKRLESTHTPAYPKYYEKVFKEVLLSVENEELQKLYERYSKEHNASNYDEEFEKFIRLAKESLSAFAQSNKSINKVATEQSHYLESIQLDDIEETHVHYERIVTAMLTFQGQLLDELRKSESKISQMESELQLLVSESKVDPLTKVLNKRAFDNDMGSLLEIGNSKNMDVSFALIDLDNFRNINDKYGFLAGDKILIFIANTLKNSLRDGDKIYRCENGEFLIVLNRLNGAKALDICDRIRQKIEVSRLVYSEQVIHATVSISVTIHSLGDEIETILRRLKSAMFEIKRAGKNKVMPI